MSDSNTSGNVYKLIADFTKIRIIASDPDLDSVGTALGLKMWLEGKGKTVELQFYFTPDELVKNAFQEYAPDLDAYYVASSSFSHPEDVLIIIVDAHVLKQVFGEASAEIGPLLVPERTVVIDHHPQDGNEEKIKAEYCVQRPASCTAEVLYAEVMSQDTDLELTVPVAECFYYALTGDTGGFSHSVRAGTFAFADKLIAAGVDVRKMTQRNTPYIEFAFLAWAIPETQLIADLRLALLAVDYSTIQQTEAKFGKGFWDSTTNYKNGFSKSVAGYDYGVMLREHAPGGPVRVNWRTRDWGNTADLKTVFTAAGFTVGGHRNAGGGEFHGTLQEAVEKFTAALRTQLNQLSATS